VYDPTLRLSAAQAQHLITQVAAALDHLHTQGLTHGDLYAHNLLVDGQGGVLLSDYGAASWCSPADPARAERLRAIDRRALAVLQAELALWG
jgi:serine/threonine protein kinase